MPYFLNLFGSLILTSQNPKVSIRILGIWNPCSKVADSVCQFHLPALLKCQMLLALETCCSCWHGHAHGYHYTFDVFEKQQRTGHLNQQCLLSLQLVPPGNLFLGATAITKIRQRLSGPLVKARGLAIEYLLRPPGSRPLGAPLPPVIAVCICLWWGRAFVL